MKYISMLLVIVGNFSIIYTVNQDRLLVGVVMTILITVISFLCGMEHAQIIAKETK